MPPFLASLLAALIPLLVTEAEKIFSRGNSGAGPQKHAWVTEMVTLEIVPILERRLPDFLKPDAAALGKAIDEGIEKALVELGL